MFRLAGRTLVYADHAYNATRVNERAVEVPVALALLCHARACDGAILEVGAVLPHYRALWPCDGHVCVDLFEPYEGVINADVLTWEPSQQFDLIVCISTLDHLRDEEEFCVALQRLHAWREPDGLLFVTLPYGQPAWIGGGQWLDRLIAGGALGADVTWRMDKTDVVAHGWEQICGEGPPRAYNYPTAYANTVYMFFWGEVDAWWQRDKTSLQKQTQPLSDTSSAAAI